MKSGNYIYILFLCAILTVISFSPAIKADNIIATSENGILEQYGSQYNSTWRGAKNIHDGSTSNEWLSYNNNSDNFFIFSFNGETEETYNYLNLYNYGNSNYSVKNFRLFSSSDPLSKTDSNHSSWEKIGIYKGGSSTLYNYLNKYLGGVLQSYGSQYNSTWRRAENVQNGILTDEWLSYNNSSNNYFIFSFEGDISALVNSFHLSNYGNSNYSVKNFQLKTSSDINAMTDPDHASWATVTGSVATDTVNILHNNISDLTKYGSQYNSTWRGAKNTHNGLKSDEWLSYNNSYNNYFIYAFKDDRTFNIDTLKLYNYGNSNYSIKDFQFFYSLDDNVSTDPDHASWNRLDGNSTSLANLISSLLGGTLEDHGSQYNTTWRSANNTHNELVTDEWLSYNNNSDNYFIYSFPEENIQTINQLDLYNYGNSNYSVKNFRLLSSNNPSAKTDPDHSSWEAIPSGANPEKANLISSYLGATLEDHGSEYNSTWRSADNTHNELVTDEWLSYNNSSDNYFIYSLPDNQSKIINQLDLYNYGNSNYSVQDFQLLYSSDPQAKTDPDHSSWVNVSGAVNNDLINILLSHIGTTLEAHGSEYNTTWRGTKNSHDGIKTNEWLSYNNNFDNYFIYSFPDNNSENFDTVKLYNYGNTYSIKELRFLTSDDNNAATDATHASWTEVTGTADAELANILNRYQGATMYYSPYQYNTTWRGAKNVNNGGVTDEWFSANGHVNDNYFIFIMPETAVKTFNKLILRNHNSVYSAKDFTLWYSNVDSDKDDHSSGTWLPITELAGDTTFTALNNSNDQTFNFNQNYSGKYFMLKITNNYGSGSYTALREIELYGTETLADYGAKKVDSSSAVQTISFNNQFKKYLMIRVLKNYGSNYTGLREIELYGTKQKDEFGIFTADKISGKQTFSFSNANTKYVQMRVLDNYGSNYTGLRDLQIYGTATLGEFGILTAAKISGKQTFSFANLNTKYVQMRVLDNYGSNYSGLRDLQIYGTATLGEFGVFTAEKISSVQSFTLNADPVNNPVPAKYVMFKCLNNYGSNYSGLREIELYGDATLADFGIFQAAKASGTQIFNFDNVTTRYFMMKVMDNYGSNYTGIREMALYGDATLTSQSVFQAAKTAGKQEFFLNETTSKYFMMKVSSNYGSNYTGMRELELYSVFDLTLQDPITSSQTVTNQSIDNGGHIDTLFSDIDSDSTHYMISEDQNFTGAVWQVIPQTPSFQTTFSLSSGDGLKTIYAAVINNLNEVENIYRTITLDTTPPPEAVSFTSLAAISNVTLTWENPNDDDYQGVMIRYSTSANPVSITDGILLNTFEGNQGSEVTITHDNLTNGTRYYYSLFTYDIAGNYSDPASTDAMPLSPAAGFGIELSTNSLIAGDNFTATVSIYKEDGALDISYNDTATLTINYVTPATGTQTFSYTQLTFNAGQATSILSYPDAGVFDITVTGSPDTSLTGQSSQIRSYPASFQVLSSTSQTFAGQPFSLTVNPVNQAGNTTPNFISQANLNLNLQAPVDGSGSLNIKDAAINGFTTIDNIIFDEAGELSIEVNDSNYATGFAINGVSTNIILTPYKIELVLSDQPSREFFYINENFNLTVSPLSIGLKPLQNYRGTIIFENSEDLNLNDDINGSQYMFTKEDSDRHIFKDLSFKTEGIKQLSIIDSEFNNIKGLTKEISIKYGSIRVEDTKGTAGTDLTFKVVIEDKEGNIIQEENDLKFKLEVVESNTNKSYILNGEDQPFTINNGAAILSISDSEAETLTITPIPEDIPLEKFSGEIIFEPITKSSPFTGQGGIRIVFWKEMEK